MKINVYAIFDVKSKLFNQPFYLINDQVALRTATDLANDPNCEISKNPEDYQLFRLGEYEDTTGLLDTKHPEIMYNMITLVNPVIKEFNHEVDIAVAAANVELQEGTKQ